MNYKTTIRSKIFEAHAGSAGNGAPSNRRESFEPTMSPGASSVRTLAPAKINVNLRILGRRADGYHLIDSLMVLISLYDELTIQATPATNSTIAVTSDSDALPSGPANLAYRAAELVLKDSPRPLDVRIHIDKRIPIGSGLGGGSSDAAAVLRVLNNQLVVPHTTAQLAALGARLGADLPFFIYGCPARIGGIGECVSPVTTWTPFPLVVCSDGYVLSTKLVYSMVDLSLTTQHAGSNIPDRFIDRESISELLVNDLEVAAAQVHPEVLLLKARLIEQGALGALMTGSGSAVFGIFADAQEARCAAATLRKDGFWAEAVHTLNTWPAVAN